MYYCYYIINLLPQSLVNFIDTILLLHKIFIPEAAYLFYVYCIAIYLYSILCFLHCAL